LRRSGEILNNPMRSHSFARGPEMKRSAEKEKKGETQYLGYG